MWITQNYWVGISCKSLGLAQEAREQFVRTAQLCREATAVELSATTLNNCAWFLVDCPDESLRDPDFAVEWAEKAVAREPQQALFWNTLGVAYYRKGDWKQARTALERSMACNDGDIPHNWFFLAMTCQRSGEKEQARSWREKAIHWMETHRARPEELLRYRAEADALLGP